VTPPARSKIKNFGKAKEYFTMDLQLKGKKAIVTGGSAGIGLGIARTLAEEGVEVTIPGRNRKKLNEAIASPAAGRLHDRSAPLL
jgi:NAD(P)-dependent dehydrogenase (short-subunit alcohol dehydrogenase family)